MRTSALTLCTTAVLLFVDALSAADAYVVRFHEARGRSAACHQAVWTNDVLLYNSNAEPVTVRLLGMTGTFPPGTVTILTLPPRRVVSLERPPAPTTYWSPFAPPNQLIWVLHLDIPDGVV